MNRRRRRPHCGHHEPYLPIERIDLAMTRPPTGPLPPGVVAHVRDDYDPELDFTVVRGIPCTTVERTIVDLGEECQVEDLVEMLYNAAHRGILDVAKLADTIERVTHPRAKLVAAEALRRWQAGDDLR